MDLPSHFDEHWKAVFARWQERSVKSTSTLKMKSFAESKKGKKVQDKGGASGAKEIARSQTQGAG